MARYISGIRKQLQDVSDLFITRYGKNSSIAEIAVKTLALSTMLEREVTLLDSGESLEEEKLERVASASS